MICDKSIPPEYGPTWCPEIGVTGSVWRWIFWWCRNGVSYVAGQSCLKHKKHCERRRHTIKEELEAEIDLLGVQGAVVCKNNYLGC